MLNSKNYGRWASLTFLFVNVGLVIWNAGIFFQARSSRSIQAKYSYVGDDFPLYYPMELDTVAMTLQESVRYDLNASDAVADAEWDMLNTMPEGFGRTRLGPEYRLFVMTVYHQMHCIRKIHIGVMDRNDTASSFHHVAHCLNYLRQLLLCTAANSLEEGDFLLKNYETDRVGDQLVCQDWEEAYKILDRNYEEWLEWRSTWN